MKSTSLISSVALFKELYNSETYKSIPQIIGEFICAAVSEKQLFSLDSTQIKELLKSVYGFDIPESVLRTTLKNQLKDKAEKDMNLYHFDKEKLDCHDTVIDSAKEITEQQSILFDFLYKYIEQRTNRSITESEKIELKTDFLNFLLGDSVSEKNSALISAFIVSQENNQVINSQINSIKEGLIIYNGICYTADINQLGSWKDELTLYLSTENLFSAIGYNGTLFKEIFDDFINLVNEINRNHKGKLSKNRAKLIQLRYLDETKSEIDWFFKMAESIKKGHKRLNSSKLAYIKPQLDCSINSF